MKYKSLFIAVALASSTLGMMDSKAEVTANVALTSDYVWRGVSQNQEDPALQGGFDYTHESGFYAGVWGSNVNFGNASTEIDLYLGWATEFDNGLGLDVGLIEYTYHGSSTADANNFTEAYIGVSHSGFSATYSFGDEFDDHWELGYEHSFEQVSVNVSYGDYDSYSYYKVGVSGEVAGLGLALDFWNTDNDGDTLFGQNGGDRVAFTVSKSF